MAIASEKELMKYPEIVHSAVALVLKDMTALVYRQLLPEWLERQPRNCWNGTLKTRKLVLNKEACKETRKLVTQAYIMHY